MPPAIRLLYVPCKNAAEARRIGDALLAERLAACANILPSVESSYMWKGKPVRAKEVPLLLKTTKALAKKAAKRVAALHSYECPCILEIDVSGNAPFARWVTESVRS